MNFIEDLHEDVDHAPQELLTIFILRFDSQIWLMYKN